jgi:putative aldouronate transport system substrate-binding protein
MKKKKIAFLFLILLICAGIISSCTPADTTGGTTTTTPQSTGTTKGTTTGTSAEPGVVTYPLEGDNLKLTYWIALRQAAYEDHLDKNICWQAIQENTGVDIEFIHPAPEQVTEQLTMLIVGGDLPDLIQIDTRYDAMGGAAGGVSEGIFYDLTDYLDENAPDYMEAVYANDLCWRMLTDADGRIFYFAQIKSDAPEYNRFQLRADIQDEIGWGDRVPVTMDDYTELCADLKEAGYYGTGLVSNGRLQQFIWPYGVTDNFYLTDDQKVSYGLIDDGFKEYLSLMNDWYDKGYIHPDFTGTLDREALFTGKEIGIRYGSSDTATSNALKNDYELIICNYPRLNEGQEISFQIVTKERKPADGIRTVVSTQCEDVELACQFLNYGYTQEGADIFNYGIEGVSYTINSEGEKEFDRELFLNHPKGWTTSVCAYVYKLHFGPKLAEPDVKCNPSSVLSPQAVKNRSMYADDPTVNGSSVIRAQLSAQQTSDRSMIMTDINAYVEEKVLQFIMGDVDIDSYWDEYVATIEGMNIDEAIAITQDAVDQYYAKEFPAR